MATEIDPTLFDQLMHNRIDFERYSQQQVRDLSGLLSNAGTEIKNKLLSVPDGSFSSKRMNALLAEFNATINDTYDSAGSRLKEEMGAFAEHASELTGSAIANQLPSSFHPAAMTADQYSAILNKTPIRLGKDQALLYDEIFGKLASGMEEKVRGAVRLGMVSGESMADITRRVMGTKANGYSDGIMEGSRDDLAKIVHTTVMHTSNQAAQITMQNNSDVLNGWIYIGTLDSKMCSYCAMSYGQQYKFGEGFPPPKHVGCRCFQAPWIKTFKELGIDAPEFKPGMKSSATGPVKSDLSYSDWIKGQNSKTQDEILGKTRGQMLRDGKLSPDKFTDASGKLLTLDQLKNINPVPAPTLSINTVTPVSKSFETTVMDALGLVPTSVHDAVEKFGYSVDIGEKLTDIRPDLKGVHPRGWPAGMTWDTADGLHNSSTRQIAIAEKYRPVGQKQFQDSTRVQGVSLHEYGHAVDVSYGNFSQTQDFSNAYNLDVAAFKGDSQTVADMRYFLQKGKAGKQEIFSEIFAQIHNNGTISKDVLATFPNVVKTIKDGIGV